MSEQFTQVKISSNKSDKCLSEILTVVAIISIYTVYKTIKLIIKYKIHKRTLNGLKRLPVLNRLKIPELKRKKKIKKEVYIPD